MLLLMVASWCVVAHKIRVFRCCCYRCCHLHSLSTTVNADVPAKPTQRRQCCAEETLPTSFSSQATGFGDFSPEDLPPVSPGVSAPSLLQASPETECCKRFVPGHMHSCIESSFEHSLMVVYGCNLRCLHPEVARLLHAHHAPSAAANVHSD